ncbi:MAG: hypothetical protein PHZ26_04310 [Candidatus Gracilibacteria bacterium]|nr:hypothetical protein [Candidatus Gracilibacteria bacterium]MDD2908951.1 hypothetical protein [Candidatus Gracilibacteria bacterium]
MKIGHIQSTSGIGKEISRQIANMELLIPEDLDIFDLVLQKQFDESSSQEEDNILPENKNLDGIVLYTDFGSVNDFANHFRENLIGIVSMVNIDKIKPLKLGIVYTGEKSEVQEIIDILRINIDEILGQGNNIGVELLNPSELKSKKVTISGYGDIIASNLIHTIEARGIDIGEDFYLPKNDKNWHYKEYQSARGNIKNSNKIHSKPKKARR